MNYKERIYTIDKILDTARKNQLSNQQKNILFEIINNSNKTEKQKYRFIKYYNLDVTQKQVYNYTTLAKECGCTPSCIPSSCYGVRKFLIDNYNDELIKKIMEA